MTHTLVYSFTGMALFSIGLLGTLLAVHVLRKILALNIMGIGVFMFLVAVAKGSNTGHDPIPHAMVLTGIVIAVAGTALALKLAISIQASHHCDSPGSDEGLVPGADT